MSDEAAPQSDAAISSIDQDALYVFTGAQVEALLLEAAGMLSTAMLPPDKVMPEAEIRLALSVGCLDHDGLKDAGTRGALLKVSPLEPGRLAQVLYEAANSERPPWADAGPVVVETYTEIAERAIAAWTEEPGAEPSPSTQQQFKVGDEVEVEGHHEHVLPPVLDGVKLPLPGKVVFTDPDHPDLVGVEVELPSGVGTRRVQLHVDQIELETPSTPETPQ